MFGIKELKESIQIIGDENNVECPVRGCNERVDKQKDHFKREDIFKCPVHNIYISPSTFEYLNKEDNLLWKEESDKQLLNNIMTVKRESRMARDNSEDAVTWNVFRFLERNHLIDGFLSNLAGTPVKSSQVIYWSYSQAEEDTWTPLKDARDKFDEREKRGSEPDIIITTDKELFFIEAKITAPNKIEFNNNHIEEEKQKRISRYSRGDRFLNTNMTFENIIDARLYELGRFWVIGSTMAENLKKCFFLINLVLERNEENIVTEFSPFIKKEPNKRFLRLTWEDIYRFVSDENSTNDKQTMLEYFRNKTIGYKDGKLQRAFSV